MPHWPKPKINYSKRINYDLTAVKKGLELLGNPHLRIPPAIHITGTNGKGSVSAYIKQIMIESGYNVHVYTSPHLIEFNERIVLANEKISDDFLKRIAEECRIRLDEHNVTFLEGATIIAFLAFSKIDADLSIIEVGMGGERDATNVIENTLISVFTPISLDHTEHLGNTIEEIALTKSGIIKQECQCVIGKQTQSARQIIEMISSKKKARIFGYSEEKSNVGWRSGKINDNEMFFECGGERIELPSPSLYGDHQVDNAGIAIATATLLAQEFNNITQESISDGLQNVEWPARLEKIENCTAANMLTYEWEMILDGAHNNAGAKVLSEWAKKQRKNIYVICGFTIGHERSKFFEILKPYVHSVYTICVSSELNAQTAIETAHHARSAGLNAKECESMHSAIECIISQNGDRGIILICGSLYLAGDIDKINKGIIA